MQSLFEKFMGDELVMEKFSDFKDSLSEEERQYIITTDPSGKFKYADWIFKRILRDADGTINPMESCPPAIELKETLSILFNKMKGEMSDINIYETYSELHQATKKLQMEAKSRQFLSAGKITGYETIPEVDYKLFLINNRFGAKKFYHDPITSWCIATDYPTHYSRETRQNSMMFVVAETSVARPRNFLALRISGEQRALGDLNNITLDSVWNNDDERNTSADPTANTIGRAIFEKEKAKIAEAWNFHFSEANKPYIDYDGGQEGEYSDMMIKRLITATIAGRTINGMPAFNNDFYHDNTEQVQRIFTGDVPLFINYLKYTNPKIQAEANKISIPVSIKEMSNYASDIFDTRSSRHSTINWGEKYFDENNGLGDELMNWYIDTGSRVSDLVNNLDKANTEHIIALIKSGSKDDIAYENGDPDDGIDIAESLDMSDPYDIVWILHSAESHAYESSAYEWLVKHIQSELESYTGVKFPSDWSPWNDKPLNATIIINSTAIIEDMLSLIGDYYDLNSIDPVHARVHYEIENNGTAEIDTGNMNNYPDDKDFNINVDSELPPLPEPIKPKPRKRLPAKKKPIVTADDII